MPPDSCARDGRTPVAPAARTARNSRRVTPRSTDPPERIWWTGGDSDPQPSRCERDALPLSYPPIRGYFFILEGFRSLVTRSVSNFQFPFSLFHFLATSPPLL